MKAYKISAILLLALVLCIAMIACTPSDESKQPITDTLPVLHYAVGANLTEEVLKAADLVMITTAHTTVDYNFVAENADLIFDTKNAMKNVEKRDNIRVL